MKFYYFYKITNRINEKFYFGVHCTDNLDDGYMGSGVALKRAYSKYGIENFAKEILAFFACEEEMYAYEEQYVNEELVANQNCYNMIKGGRNREVTCQLSLLAKKANITDEVLQRKREGIYRYWTTGDIEAKKRKISEATKKYWNTGDVAEKHRRQSEIQKTSYRLHPERRAKLTAALDRRWNGANGENNRKKLGEALRNSEKHKAAVRRLKESGITRGYNNFDFKKRWKPIYESRMREICEFLQFSNLPDQFVVNVLFGLPVKSKRVIEYYQSVGELPPQLGVDNKVRFLRLDDKNGTGHKDGGSKKTLFSPKIKYDIALLHHDFFDQFEKIREIEGNDEISDSMVYNQINCNIRVKNFKQVLEYFTELGVVFHIHQVTVRVWKTVAGKTFTVPSQKTKFSVDFSNLNKILIDKEFNLYGIDDNGRPFCKGRFELEINGEKRPL